MRNTRSGWVICFYAKACSIAPDLHLELQSPRLVHVAPAAQFPAFGQDDSSDLHVIREESKPKRTRTHKTPML